MTAAKRPRRISAQKIDDVLPPEASDAAVGQRLKILRRLILDLRQNEIARRVGISPPAWHHYEAGGNAPEWSTACKIAIACDVTMDWIYRGERRGLPLATRKLLEVLDRAAKLNDDKAD